MNRCKVLLVSLLLLWSTQIFGQQTAINRGVEWLVATQNLSGSWGTETDYPNLCFRDTGLVADSLCYLGLSGSLTTLNAINWVGSQTVSSGRNLSRQIIPLANFGTDTTELVNLLVSYQNEDGGFSGYNFKDVDSFLLDTTLSLSALKSANSSSTVIFNALSYLLANQNTDGGFGVAGKLSLADESAKQSNVYITSLALLILTQYRKDFYLEESLTKAGNWLISQQKPDGSFGTIWETGLAYSALMKVGSEKWGAGSKTACLEYILANQKDNGSWEEDPFTTALCLRAVKDSMPPEAFADLEVKAIWFTPPTPSAGEIITLNAVVFNPGDTEIEDAEAQFYLGTSTIGPMLFVPKLAPKEYATVTISTSFLSGTHSISAVVDPRRIIPERNETNNTATTTIVVSEAVVGPPDLIITELSVSNLTPVRGENILISARIKNTGEGTATNILVRFLSDDKQIGDNFVFDSLSENEEAIAEIEVSFDTGTHNILVAVDPDNTISEQDEGNNYATITVFATEVRELPDISIKEITYQPPSPSAGDTVEFKIIIQNLGKGDCRNAKLDILINTILAKSFIIPQLLPLGSFTLVLTTNLNAGTNTITIIADPYSELAELNESNNTVSQTVYILPAILPPPDLVVIEIYSDRGSFTSTEIATFTATIKNKGSLTAFYNTCFWQAYVETTNQWHNLTSSLNLGNLPSLATQTLRLITAIPWEGTVNVVLRIDPENSIEELDETNNIGTVTVVVYPPVVGRADLEPALKIEPVSPEAGKSGTITATIVNKGESPAYNFIVILLLQSNGMNMNREFSIERLSTFSTYTISLLYNLSAGSYTVSCKVDIHNTVLEENELNNTAELQFIVSPPPPPALPDLTIKAEDISISPVLPNTAQTITITAVVYNVGNANAQGVLVRLYDGEPKWKRQLGGDVVIGSIPILGTASVKYETTLSVGTHTLYLVVDEGNIIAEADETNNSAGKDVYVKESPPDLIITELNIYPPSPTNRDEIRVTVEVLNQGGAQARNIFVFARLDSTILGEFAISQLSSSEAKTIFFTTGPLSEGSYTFTLIVDPDDLVQEGNEANNIATKILKIRSYLMQTPKVTTVPWLSQNLSVPHETWIGRKTILKGVAHDPDGDHTMVSYKWDFGDGYTTNWLSLVNPYIIEAAHTYTGKMADETTYGPGQFFIATLYVKDKDDLIGKDTYFIGIKEKTQGVEVNVAIDDMLWWLHKQQSRGNYGDSTEYGYWYSAYGSHVSYTAASVESFELMGHLPEGDSSEDPYIETVQRGLNYLFNHFYTLSISQHSTYCPLGNPDMNGNGIGLACYDYSQIYDTGMVLMAISSSGAPNRIALIGSPNVKGRTYKDIAQDMVDYLAWGQTDPYAGNQRGGWRYSANYGQSDNSVSQWPVIGMEAAERNFGRVSLKMPDFVRPELLKWLSYTQNPNGGFGYQDAYGWVNTAKTGAGCAMLSWAGVLTSDDRFKRALSFLNNQWYNTAWQYTNFGDYYTMYSIMKGMRIPEPDVEMIGAHNWYSEYSRFIVDELNKYGGEYVKDTSWLGVREVQPVLATAWAIAILVQTPVTPSPVADAGADVDKHPPLIPVRFDGSGSYHRDPTRRIVLYEWDFESDGIYDMSSTQPYATHTYLAYDAQGIPTTIPDKIDWAKTARDYQARLKVEDDWIPPQADTDECMVRITPPPWPPIADAGGPYSGTKNTTLILDGSRSYDPNGRMYPEPTHPWHGYITSYLWDLDNDGKYDDAQGEKVEWKVPGSGIYPIGLKVVNNFGYTDVDNTVVNVENHPPSADADGPYIISPDGKVIFDGSSSYDPDGDLLWFTWDFDSDGVYDTPAMLSPIATYTYTLKKQYVATLKVSDGEAYSLSTATVYPLPEIFSSVATDKLFYSAQELVTIISKAKSTIADIILYDLPLELDIDGEKISKEIPILTPQSLWSSKSYWNTGTHTPGKYLVTQTILYGTQTISVATCTFRIISTDEDLAGISGDIEVTPEEVKTYGSLTFDYQVNNIGNTDLLNIPLNILIIDPDTGELKYTLTDVATITKGASFTNSQDWKRVTLFEPKVYLAILQAQVGTLTKSLDFCHFKVLPFGWAYGQVEGYAYSRALDFAIYTEKEQSYIGGGGKGYTFVLGGAVHSNAKAVINNPQHRIVESGYLNDSPIIGVTPGEPNPNYSGNIPFPTINWEYYRRIAKEQNRYYTSLVGVSLPQGKDQVTVVELSKEGGELMFSGNSKGEGTLILWTQDNTAKLDLKFSGTVDFKGLIYTNAQIELSGNVKIEGGIIAKSATLNGTPRVYYKPQILWQEKIPLIGALITAKDEITRRIATTTTTSPNGTYTLLYLIPGTYTVTAEKEDYIASSTYGVIIEVSKSTQINFILIAEKLLSNKNVNMENTTQEPSITNLYQDLTQAYCYPNPSKTGWIRFDGLSYHTRIMIFNIAGELVYESDDFNGSQSQGTWLCENNAGKKVASGIYIYILKDQTGNVKKGKLGVIR